MAQSLKPFVGMIAWPIMVLGAAATLVALVLNDALTPITMLALAVVQLLLVTVFELLAPHRDDWRMTRDKRLPNDLGHVLVNALLGDRLGGLVFVGVSASLALTFLLNGVFNLWPDAWPLWQQALLAVLVIEVLDYWRHRLDHQVAWLWPLHLVHHTPETMNAIKSARNHFGDMIFRHAFAYMPVLIAGAPAEAILWHAAAISLFGIPGHANVGYQIPRLFDHLVMTPAYHRVHHSNSLKWGNSNYTNLFGTFSDPAQAIAEDGDDVGVEFNPVPQDFLSECLTPILWFTKQRR